MSKDKEERKLKKAKIDLMRNPKFALWSGIMMVGKTEVVDGFPTAATNGRDELYGREFIKKLDEKELRFVILHENLHKAFRHLTTWRKLWDENKRVANMACDYVINLILVNSDPLETLIAMPRENGKQIGLVDKRFAGMNTKQVFDILKQEQDENGEGDSGESGESMDHHDWEGAKELTEQEKEELEREIDQALRQGQMNDRKLNGDKGSGGNRELDALLKPQVDWREALREFVKSVCSAKDVSSWRRVNRRFLSGDVYMPSLIGERIGRIAIGIDTSGSIGRAELTKFLSEVKAIADDVHPEAVDLIYWDTRVAAHETYDELTTANIVSSTKPAGGGGTDPRCMSQYLKDNRIVPECIVMLTDGEIGSWGDDWDAPVLWAIANTRKNITAPNGKTIHIEG
jgi:predicted metal-dependent peptidase